MWSFHLITLFSSVSPPLAWWIAPCPLSSLSFYWALHHNRHVGTKPALRDPPLAGRQQPCANEKLNSHYHVKTELKIEFTLFLFKSTESLWMSINSVKFTATWCKVVSTLSGTYDLSFFFFFCTKARWKLTEAKDLKRLLSITNDTF